MENEVFFTSDDIAVTIISDMGKYCVCSPVNNSSIKIVEKKSNLYTFMETSP